MIADLVTGLGLVAVIEGLALILLPVRFEDVLELLARMDVATRRRVGLVAVAAGVVVVWMARFVIA